MAKVTARQLDFSGVKDGGGQFSKKRVPAGDYLGIIVKVEDALSKEDKKPMYLFTIKLKKYPSATYPYYTKLVENQLWKLRNIMIAGGKNVPKSKIKVDPNVLVGKTIGVSLEDTEYEKDGKTFEQSQIEGVFPASELADQPGVQEEVLDDSEEPEEDEDVSLDDDDLSAEEPEAADDEAEDEVESEADDEEEEAEASDPYADMDRTALKAALKARDASFQAKKSQTDDDLRDLLRAGDGDAEEEAEEEPAPVVQKTTRKVRPKAEEVSDEELDELDIDAL